VGSMKEAIEPGHLVVVDNFIDRTRHRIDTFFDDDGVVAHVSFAEPIDAALAAAVHAACERAGAIVHRGGTYLCMEGPQFSTRAESMLYRSWGVEVIGMTNMPECRLAREAELPYATLALATDYDCWHQGHDAVTLEGVLAVMHQNVSLAKRVLRELVRSLPDPQHSPATTAMATSIVTDRSTISAAAREKLAPLVGRYL